MLTTEQYISYFENAWSRFAFAFVFISPPICFSLVLSIISEAIVGDRKNKGALGFQVLFFCLLSIVVAQLQFKGNDIVGTVLASVITVSTVLAQIVGQMKSDMTPPISTGKSFAVATCAVTVFLFTFVYFGIVRNAGGASGALGSAGVGGP